MEPSNSSNLALSSNDQTHNKIVNKTTNPVVPSDCPTKKFKFINKKLLLWIILGVGGIVTAIYGYHWWRYTTTHQETDNAYVTANINPINARISGTVVEVSVNDNQQVTLGMVLVKLDPHDYQVSLQQAQASLESARRQAEVAQANIDVTATNAQGKSIEAQGNIDAARASILENQATLSEVQAGVPVAEAQLAQVEANLVKAELDYERYTTLFQAGAVAKQQLDAAKATYGANLAQRNAVREQVRQAKAKVIQAQQSLSNVQAKLASSRGGLQQAKATTQQTEVSRRQYQAELAAVAQVEAQVKNAQIQLSYTNITSPIAGQIGNKIVQIGQRVQPGQLLMAIVQPQPWIIANFKETQLEKMQPGQVVEIKIDAIASRTFRGKIDSLSPASGNRFALLPSDNATGNFTKIVQRVPVKIVFDAKSIRGYESRITSGISAVVSVEVR